MPCSYDGCPEDSGLSCCDQCNKLFCSDHGTRGGDRQVQDVGAVAYPALCFRHGGFNADS